MTKDDMMLLTIKQLSEYFSHHPECFVLDDHTELNLSYSASKSATIVFQSSNDIMSNPRTVSLQYSDHSGVITCNIYFRNVMIGASLANMKPDATIMTRVKFKWFNKSYKEFKKLRTKMVLHLKDKENNEFMKKLHSVFPGVFDGIIFGKRDE